jgi:uncharacterized SAM-binding protein YcdF (DUF218 family)
VAAAFLLLPLIVHKALPALVQPLGLCFLLGLAGLAFRKRWPAAAGLALLWVASLGVVGGGLIGILERQYPVIQAAECPEAGAVIVLGGILNDDPRTQTPEWGASVNRFERGLDLVRLGRVGTVVFTTARIPWQRADLPDEGAILRQAALMRGVPAERIVMTEGVVNNTAGEAREVKLLMAKHGWRRVVVVTSAFHMPRAMLLMRREGVDAIPFPTDHLNHPGHVRTVLDWLPSAQALRWTEVFINECLGLAYYSLGAG